jgi:AraC-like DNA-binding protein
MFNHDLKTGLSVIWNKGKKARFMIDNEVVELGENCIIFITEFFVIDNFEFERMNVLQFNREFYCVQDNDELGCRGLLFYGGAKIPKIIVPKAMVPVFEQLWEVFMVEIDEMKPYKLEMLKSLLLRFLILCLRTYKVENFDQEIDHANIGLIREYNYLVEKNYRTHSKVSDYASMLFRSPKTLANIFKKYIDKTPLQVINDRRLLEARRMLKYTDAPILEISEALNFRDVQSFSHFFNTRTGSSPSAFRKSSVG